MFLLIPTFSIIMIIIIIIVIICLFLSSLKLYALTTAIKTNRYKTDSLLEHNH